MTLPKTPRPSETPDLAVPWRDQDQASGAPSTSTPARVEDTSTRELYSHLINLLSQDAQPEEHGGRRIAWDNLAMALRRRWLPMLLIFALSAIPLARWLKPKTSLFTATSTILLPPNVRGNPATLRADDGSDTVVSEYDTEAQIAIITSPRNVADAMQKYLTPEQRRKGWGDVSAAVAPVTADAPLSPNLISISATGLHPGAAQQLSNALGQVYIDYTRESATGRRDKDFRFVKERRDQVRNQLEQAKRALQSFKESHGVADLGHTQASTLSRLEEAKREAEATQVELQSGDGAASIAGDGTLNSLRGAVTTALGNVNSARARYEDISRDRQPSTRPVIEAKFALDRSEAALQRAQQAVDARLSSLRETVRERAAQAQSKLAQTQQAAAVLPGVENDITQLISNVQSLETTYKSVSAQLTKLTLSQGASVPVPSRLKPATVAPLSNAQWIRAIAVSFLCAMILSALTGFLLERMDRGVHSAGDLEKVIEAPILGMLPALPNSVERRLTHMSSRGAEAQMLESCYKLRSNLVEAAYKNGVRSLLLTSAVSDEGKSLCALNVAAALAYDGHRVLLVDADFWNPTQHLLAEVTLEPGYSDLLSGQVPFENAVRASNIHNMWVLPSGALVANLVELLNSDGNRRRLKEFKETFDFVIIDSPPTLSLADAQVLSSLADAVALVVAESTSDVQVQRAQAVLHLTGGRLLGVILNKDRSSGRGAHGPSAGRGNAFDEYQTLLRKNGHQLARLD